MATDKAQINYGFRWVYSTYGDSPITVEVPFKVSQTLKCGNAVIRSYTSGSLRQATELSTSLFGVMQQNLTTTATEGSTKALVIPFAPGYVWEVRGAPGMSGGSPIAVQGRFCDLELSTANIHRIDTGGTISMFQIVGSNPLDKGLTTRGNRYWVMIRGSMTQWGARETEH